MTDAPTLRLVRLSTPRTGRVAWRGPDDPSAVRALWVVLHGYGHLAADFLAGFDAADDAAHRIVAPEALSRFYAPRGGDVSVAAHREAPVGASWMTREDRLEEIADHLEWITRACADAARDLDPGVPLTVLGFSQGATAASRWVASGRFPVRRLICWGQTIAPELDLGPGTPLRRARTTLVIGDRDGFIPPGAVATERARLDAAGFPHEVITFAGGHRLDDATLGRLAREDA